MRITRFVNLTLGTGLWGGRTADNTIYYVNEAICRITKMTSYSKATGRAKIVDNEHIKVMITGTLKQVDRIEKEIAGCVIAIDGIESGGVDVTNKYRGLR